MTKTSFHCRGCGRFGTRDCPEKIGKREPCDSYLSWSDVWTRETAAIERAQRITYVAAALLIALATAALILPKAMLS